MTDIKKNYPLLCVHKIHFLLFLFSQLMMELVLSYVVSGKKIIFVL